MKADFAALHLRCVVFFKGNIISATLRSVLIGSYNRSALSLALIKFTYSQLTGNTAKGVGFFSIVLHRETKLLQNYL